MLTTLTIIILGLAAYIGVLLNQKRETDSVLRLALGAMQVAAREIVLLRGKCPECGETGHPPNDVGSGCQHDRRTHPEPLSAARECEPGAYKKHVVPLPAEPLYLCQRPVTCKCKDRVVQDDGFQPSTPTSCDSTGSRRGKTTISGDVEGQEAPLVDIDVQPGPMLHSADAGIATNETT